MSDVAAKRFSRAKPSTIDDTGEVAEGGLDAGRKMTIGSTWDIREKDRGQEVRRIKQQEVAGQVNSVRITEKLQSGFKISNISSAQNWQANQR